MPIKRHGVYLGGEINACVEDLDTNHRNTSTVVWAVEGCTHAQTIDDCNPKNQVMQGASLFMFVISNRHCGI